MNQNDFKATVFSLVIIFCGLPSISHSQKIDTGKNKVQTDIQIPFRHIGTVVPKNTNEIQSSNWLIGCETLDRDFADYDQYKEYIAPLGIKRLRMQAGWDKTEKIKGRYDWTWLDHIINDAVSRGFQPWLQTSYGNHNYPGGGGANLGAGMPTAAEALSAWDKWVTAMVTRYKNEVTNWEIWNEPNFGDNEINTPLMTARLNIRTAEIIKRIQPDAIISGLSFGHISLPFAEEFFKILAEKGKMNLFDNMTYHDYVYNPDANYDKVEAFRNILHKYAPGMKIRQGENGAPSGGGFGRGALGDYAWSELTQAKWDVRRMLGNLGHDIECSIFGLIEMAYNSGPISQLNYKGIIKSDSTKKVIRPKMAYYAMQNVTSVFDKTLDRLGDMHATYNVKVLSKTNEHLFTKGTDRSLSVYGYRNKNTGRQLYSIWADEFIPTDNNNTRKLSFSFANCTIVDPVFVDIITGSVYEIPAANWAREGNTISFKEIPIYDAPVLIADKSLVVFR
jgi:hypothetical protein